ncbi:uncharacterized protein [Montipora foliosa]|uniref:uncharacterized protein n=1 Tax=Montipora foliosa TaxID=591990 RepID=UPI0035F13BAF
MKIYFLVCAMLNCCAYQFIEGKMYTGSITLQQKWTDFRGAPESTQFQVMIENIEKSIRRTFKNDSYFEGVQVTRLREHQANSVQGNLAVDFEISFNNNSRISNSVYTLFKTVQRGALDSIPVKSGSLVINGLSKVLKRFSMTSLTPPHHYSNADSNHDFVSVAVPVFQNVWPSGSYGLPKPRSGCPDNNWREGYRYHDSENVENSNFKSNKSKLSGNVTLHGIRQEFCIHLDQTTSERLPWPHGKYCIYKKGGTCPDGLQEGWVRWDDENTHIDYPNSLGGEVPDGIYGENTVIYFCCSTSGKNSEAILLPHKFPFYLIAFGSSRCQKVLNHKVTSEYLQFDDEDQGNSNAYSHISPFGAGEDPYNNRIYYCYYEPIAGVASVDVASSRQFQISASTPEHKENLVPRKATRLSKFATGGGVGIILMSFAAVAVFARRFNSRARAS